MKYHPSSLQELIADYQKSGIKISESYLKGRQEAYKKLSKRTPYLWQKIMQKRYVLPNYRQPDYYNQTACDYMILDMIINYTLGEFLALGRDDVMIAAYMAFIRAQEFDRPTFYLERELGEPLLRTKLPGDYEMGDINWRYPAFRVYLPKDLLTISREDGTSSMMFIDITRIEEKTSYHLPDVIKRELYKEFGSRYFPPAEVGYNGLVVVGNMDFDSPCCSIAYAASTPIDTMNIDRLMHELDDHPLTTPNPSDATDQTFTRRMLGLAVNILISLSAYPIEYNPQHPAKEDVIRVPKLEGQRLIPGLYKAKFVGEQMLRATKPRHRSVEHTGISLSPHWKAGHWRRVPYGPNSSQRRLQWIGTYHVG
jgi:hypothetical protein